MIIVLLAAAVTAVHAQDELTLQKAIETGLKNSFDIQLAKNNEEIAKNNASAGNAGMLPFVDLNAGQNNSVSNTHQEYSSGNVVDRSGARSYNQNAAVALDWTLFDGFRMFTTYNKLQEFQSRGELVMKFQVQQVVAEISRRYYDVVRLQEQVKVLETAMKLSEERTSIAKDRKDIGAGSNFDLLQAQLDQNSDKSQLVQLQNQVSNAYVSLNASMGLDPAAKVIVSDTVIPVRTLNYEELKKSFLEKNYELQVAQIDNRIAMLQLKEIKSQRLPVVSLNSSYNFLNVNNDVGLVTLNQNKGFAYGLTLSYPIFDGFNVNRQVKNANLNIENTKLETQRLALDLNSQFEILYRSYEAAKQVAAIEKTNLDISAQNMDIANERLKLGTVSSLEWRDVQLKYVDAGNRLLGAMYVVKVTEIQLLQLADMLQ